MAIPDLTDAPLAELVSLRGRRAVITGGAQGLGSAIARRFAEAGAAVLLADIDAAAAAQTAAALAAELDATVLSTWTDVTDSAAIVATADAAVAELGGIDIWVNNAGICLPRPALELSDEDWAAQLDINLRGVFVGAREAARRMVDAGHGGVILNLSSTAAYKGVGPGIAHYVASKHGVLGLTRQLALELAPHGIRVLDVASTVVVTPGVMAALGSAADAGIDNVDGMLNGLLGRAGRPDDVARIALFCASDLSMFMTGSSLLADQGEMVK